MEQQKTIYDRISKIANAIEDQALEKESYAMSIGIVSGFFILILIGLIKEKIFIVIGIGIFTYCICNIYINTKKALKRL